jgi:hypothetical protein
MDRAVLLAFLGWCLVGNFAALLLWVVFAVAGRRLVAGLHDKLFPIEEPEIVKIHYFGIMLYKLLIIFFLLVPYLVLRLM